MERGRAILTVRAGRGRKLAEQAKQQPLGGYGEEVEVNKLLHTL